MKGKSIYVREQEPKNY